MDRKLLPILSIVVFIIALQGFFILFNRNTNDKGKTVILPTVTPTTSSATTDQSPSEEAPTARSTEFINTAEIRDVAVDSQALEEVAEELDIWDGTYIWDLGYEFKPKKIEIEFTHKGQKHFPIMYEKKTISSFGSQLLPGSTMRIVIYIAEDYEAQIVNDGNPDEAMSALTMQALYRISKIKPGEDSNYYAEVSRELPAVVDKMIEQVGPLFRLQTNDLSFILHTAITNLRREFKLTVSAQGACSLQIIACASEVNYCTCTLGGGTCVPNSRCGPANLGTCSCTPSCADRVDYECGQYVSAESCNSAGCTGNGCATGGWCSWIVPPTATNTPRPFVTNTPRPPTNTVGPNTPTPTAAPNLVGCGADGVCYSGVSWGRVQTINQCRAYCGNNSPTPTPVPTSLTQTPTPTPTIPPPTTPPQFCSGECHTAAEASSGIYGTCTLQPGNNTCLDNTKQCYSCRTGSVCDWELEKGGCGAENARIRVHTCIGGKDLLASLYTCTPNSEQPTLTLRNTVMHYFEDKAYVYEYVIDWGDGTSQRLNASLDPQVCQLDQSRGGNEYRQIPDAKDVGNKYCQGPEILSNSDIGPVQDRLFNSTLGIQPVFAYFNVTKPVPYTRPGDYTIRVHASTLHSFVSGGSQNNHLPNQNHTYYEILKTTNLVTTISTPTPTPTPIPTCDIQGLKFVLPGRQRIEPAINGTSLSLDGGAGITDRPYYFSDISVGNHTVTSSIPGVNWDIFTTSCRNDSGYCHDSLSFVRGTSITVDCPTDGFVDLWWYYLQYGGWYRVRDGSLNYQGNIVNYIPPTVVPYDSFDTNEVVLMNSATTNPNSSGIVTAATIDVGPNGSVSNRSWAASSYNAHKGILNNIESFVEYARAKKDVVLITDINNVQSDRINIFEGDLDIASNDFLIGKRNVVLIVTGDVNIANIPGDIFNFPNARVSIAIVTPRRIIFGPSINDAGGIFIANEIDPAGGVTSSITPLKVAGNVISNAPITQKRRRPDSEFQQASFYVVFRPQMYVDLLPYLSTIEISGRQLDQ